MTNYELQPSQKNIIDSLINDSIDRNKDVFSFVKLIEEWDQGFSIALDGKWGSGKTFFSKQAQFILEALNPNSTYASEEEFEKVGKLLDKNAQELRNYPPVVTVYYDAWKHDNDMDPILSLVYSIMLDNKDSYKPKNRKKLFESVASLTSAVFGRDFGKTCEAFSGEDFLSEIEKQWNLAEIVKAFLASLLPEKGNRLVIFIDELDRCTPMFAVKLLERIKHYFAVENVLFVFSVNVLELEKTIKQYYGHEFDSCRYLDRFFDIKVSVPRLNAGKFFERCVFGGESGNIRECTCLEVMKQMDMSIREMEHYLRLTKSAAFRHTDEDGRDRYYGIDQGYSRTVGYSIIVPIAIGLKLTKTESYNQFISGENGEWLKKIMLSDILSMFVRGALIGEGEKIDSLDEISIKTKERVEQVYDAVLGNKYEGNSYQKAIGKCIFTKDYRYELIKAVNLMSPATRIDV